MARAPDDLDLRSLDLAGRRSSWKLVGVIGVIIAGTAASIIYNTTRQDTERRQAAMSATAGDPAAAPVILKRRGCTGCHAIPGMAGESGLVGPNLAGLSSRLYVAGVTTNTPEHLTSFIVDPKSIDAKSAMPRTGITVEEARAVAAYLYSVQ